MTTALVKTEEIGKQIDTIVEECLPAAMHTGGFNEALILARGVKTLREIFLQNPEIKESVEAMANTPLGFVTDRSPASIEHAKRAGKQPPNPYSYEEIAECCIEAMLRGYRITGNEFNVMSGRFYAAKDGKYRKIIEYPGITDFKSTTTPPVYAVENRISYGQSKPEQFAKIRCFASWKKDGVKQFIGKDSETGSDEDTLTFKIKAYGNDDDQVIGKALSKLFSRVLMRITGQIMPEMTDVDDAPITIEAPRTPEATSGKPVYDIKEAPEAEQPEKKDPHRPVDVGHRSGNDRPPESKPEETQEPEPDSTPPAAPYTAADFHRKREATIRDLIANESRLKATPQHVLSLLWTKIKSNKWQDMEHPLYLEWQTIQAAGKEDLPKFTGAPTDKIINDPERTALKRIHAAVKEKGLDPVGGKAAMGKMFDVESSGDIEIRQVNGFIDWLDDLVPVKNLVSHLTDAQKIMADSGKDIDLIALALAKVKEQAAGENKDAKHLYQIYDDPKLIEWIMENMDSWLVEPEKKAPEQKHIALKKMIPTLKTVMDVVNYAADLTGIPKDNPLEPQFTQLATSVQVFILEGFSITEQELAAGLPDKIGEKFRDHFTKWFEAQKF